MIPKSNRQFNYKVNRKKIFYLKLIGVLGVGACYFSTSPAFAQIQDKDNFKDTLSTARDGNQSQSKKIKSDTFLVSRLKASKSLSSKERIRRAIARKRTKEAILRNGIEVSNAEVSNPEVSNSEIFGLKVSDSLNSSDKVTNRANQLGRVPSRSSSNTSLSHRLRRIKAQRIGGYVSGDNSKGVSQDVSRNLSENISQDISQSTSKKLSVNSVSTNIDQPIDTPIDKLEQPLKLANNTDNSSLSSTSTVKPSEETPSIVKPKTTTTPLTGQTQTSISQKVAQKVSQGGVVIVAPTADAIMDVPATTVIIQFPVGKEAELRVNGKAVDRTLIGRTETNNQNGVITQTWYGVSLKQGDNTIDVKVIGDDTAFASTKVTVRGLAEKLQIETVEARIPADGRSIATIQGQLFDENGNRSNQDAVITLSSTAGKFTGADFKPDQPGFQVEAKRGVFTTTLQSGLKAEQVRIRAQSGSLEAFTQIQFETALRPSLVTGVIDFRLGGRGTDFYSKFRDFLPLDEDNSTRLNVNSAIFATGNIGEWLVTGAYNSDRNLNENCNCETNLFRNNQFREQNYPVYGDSSTVESLTPSTDSVYLRLERSSSVEGAEADYLMWGDYNTNEFARSSQQFTALTRQLHGFKTNYNLGNLQLSGFYANNVQGFQRDTLPPDGTSGFYFLSRRILVEGSEDIFLELEELNRPGTVLERKRLQRGPDYEIDYDRGTILFREPVLRTDVGENGEVLVRRIVATYQYEGEDNESNLYGGRLQYNLGRGTNQKSWLAATYIKENQGNRDFELYGADAKIALGSRGSIIAEYAHSNHNFESVSEVGADAWRAEADLQLFRGLQARAYYRYADEGFANNATTSFVAGQTRYGAQLNGRLTKTTNLRFQYDREENFGVAPRPLTTFDDLFEPRTTAVPGARLDNSLTTIGAGVEQRIGKAQLSVDWFHRDRQDNISNNLDSSSDQLRSRFTLPLAKYLTFQAQNELTLSDDVDAVYSDRTILGVNWRLSPNINVSLAQQFYTRGQFKGNSITNLSVNGKHDIFKNTSVTGRFSILGGSNELTTQGALGLNHKWSIAPGLRLNLAYERVFGDFLGRNGTGVQFRQPFAVGQSAASLGFDSGDTYSVGLEYTDNPNLKASARFEHRDSRSGSNTVLSASAAGKITRSLSILGRYQQASSSNQSLDLGDTANLRLGLAYRNPKDDKFNALLRYEYRKNPATIPDTILIGSGTGSRDHTFAAEAIYAPDWRWEFYGKYALRKSRSYLANDLIGTSSINLGQLRATYRLGYSWDVVGEARVIGQKDYTETGFLVEAGYYLTPNLRLAAGYALGNVDDRDFDGSRSAGGPYLGLTVKLNQLFNGFGLQKVAPKQQKESWLTTFLNEAKRDDLKAQNNKKRQENQNLELEKLSRNIKNQQAGLSEIGKSWVTTLLNEAIILERKAQSEDSLQEVSQRSSQEFPTEIPEELSFNKFDFNLNELKLNEFKLSEIKLTPKSWLTTLKKQLKKEVKGVTK